MGLFPNGAPAEIVHLIGEDGAGGCVGGRGRGMVLLLWGLRLGRMGLGLLAGENEVFPEVTFVTSGVALSN